MGVHMDHDVLDLFKSAFNGVMYGLGDLVALVERQVSVGADLDVYVDPAAELPGADQVHAQDLLLLGSACRELLLDLLSGGVMQELAAWLGKYDCKEVCMESAGKFWIPVFNVLEKSCWVTLAHPKYTKPQKGNKTDRKDAKWICDLFMCDMIKPSFIPPRDIRQLRDLMRYRMKLTNMLTGEKNRALNCLTVSNLKLDPSPPSATTRR